jgi:Uma2 family endonuclease
MPATLTTRRFTVDEYYRMAEAGIPGAGERVELIEGKIVQMAAIGSRHAGCVKRLLVRSYRRGDVLRPSVLPGLEVAVADILR